MSNTKEKLKVLAFVLIVSFILSFVFSGQYERYSQIASANKPVNYDKMVGPRSVDPIKDILEVSRAYGAIFGVDSCSLAKSMTGVFYNETNGVQNLLSKPNAKHVGSYQQIVPFVITSLKFVGGDLSRMYKLAKQGKIDKTTVEYIAAALRQGRALGPDRGRLHHLYSTVIALAQHARIEKALQRITQNQLERGAAHVIFQFAPPKVGYAIRSGKLNTVADFMGNCGLYKTTVANAIKHVAYGKTSCRTIMIKGMNKQNCSTPAGYDGPSGIGSLAEVPNLPPVRYTPSDLAGYLPPADIPPNDPFASYNDILKDFNLDYDNDLLNDNNTSPDIDNTNNDDKEEKSWLDKFDEMMMKKLFGEDMQGTLNPDLINQNSMLDPAAQQFYPELGNNKQNQNDFQKQNNTEVGNMYDTNIQNSEEEYNDYSYDDQSSYESETYSDSNASDYGYEDVKINDDIDFFDDQRGNYSSVGESNKYASTDIESKNDKLKKFLRPSYPRNRHERTTTKYSDVVEYAENERNYNNSLTNQENESLIPLQEIYDEKQKAPDFLTDTGSFEQNVFDTDSPGRLAYYFDQDKDLTVKTEDIEAFMRYMSELEKKDPEAFYRQNIKEEQQIMQTQQKQKPSFWQWLWYIFSFKWLFN